MPWESAKVVVSTAPSSNFVSPLTISGNQQTSRPDWRRARSISHRPNTDVQIDQSDQATNLGVCQEVRVQPRVQEAGSGGAGPFEAKGWLRSLKGSQQIAQIGWCAADWLLVQVMSWRKKLMSHR